MKRLVGLLVVAALAACNLAPFTFPIRNPSKITQTPTAAILQLPMLILPRASPPTPFDISGEQTRAALPFFYTSNLGQGSSGAETTAPPTGILPIPALSSGSTCPPADTDRTVAQVIEILDGDTIKVDIGGLVYSVRYIGIDAPEVTGSAEVFSSEAANANAIMVSGQSVTLVSDVSQVDHYNRLLRYVLVGEVFVNYELVRLGYARPAAYPPDTACQDVFAAAGHEAQDQQRGLWAAAAPIIPQTETPVLSGLTGPPALPDSIVTLPALPTPSTQASTLTKFPDQHPPATSRQPEYPQLPPTETQPPRYSQPTATRVHPPQPSQRTATSDQPPLPTQSNSTGAYPPPPLLPTATTQPPQPIQGTTTLTQSAPPSQPTPTFFQRPPEARPILTATKSPQPNLATAVPTALPLPTHPDSTPSPPPIHATPTQDVASTASCHPAYFPGACIPIADDVNCKDIPDSNFSVPDSDPYGFDADGDKIGCEE